jgi:hypothetical protein
MINAFFTVPSRQEEDGTRPYRRETGFRGKAVKVGEDGDRDIYKLTFQAPGPRSRFYMVMGEVVDRKNQTVEALKVRSKDHTYVEVLVPPGHGVLVFILTMG